MSYVAVSNGAPQRDLRSNKEKLSAKDDVKVGTHPLEHDRLKHGSPASKSPPGANPNPENWFSF